MRLPLTLTPPHPQVESGALRCKGRDPNVRPLNPSEWRSGAYADDITAEAAAAAAALASSGGAEGAEGAEGGGGAAAWDPRDGIDPRTLGDDSLAEDPRAAETAVPIDEHPFLAVLKVR